MRRNKWEGHEMSTEYREGEGGESARQAEAPADRHTVRYCCVSV